MKRRQLEHDEQCAVIDWARHSETRLPPLRWLHAIPNGGYRNIIVAMKLQQEGVKRGVSDLFLPWAARGYHGFYLEMKRPGAMNEVKTDQLAFVEYCGKAGYLAQVFDNSEAAIEALEWYLNSGEAR